MTGGAEVCGVPAAGAAGSPGRREAPGRTAAPGVGARPDAPLSDEARARIEELRAHASEEGERGDSADVAAELDGALVFEQRMALVRMPAADGLFAVPSGQDWVHDALDEGAEAIEGVLYASGEPFRPGEAAVDGYFQADADGRWVCVRSGVAACAPGSREVAWADELEDFPEVMEELERCMAVPEYRRVAEQAAMKFAVGAL